MKVVLVIILALYILIEGINSIENKIVEEFIRTAKNKTISIVSIENAESNFILQQFPSSMPRVILRFSLKNCSSYANLDMHENHTKLIDILACMEHNDFIIITSLQSLTAALHCIVHPLSRFLLIVTDTSALIEENLLTTLLNNTWMSNGALKVFICSQNDTKLYVFNPFHRHANGSFGKLNSFVNYSFNESEMRGNSKQLNGYPLRIEMFTSTYSIPKRKPATHLDDYYGPDVNVAILTGKLWNSSIVVVKNDGSKFGFKYPNGTLTGALKSISRRETDVAFVTFFIKDYETKSLEFSASLYSDDLCLIVKKAGRIPQFIVPLITFDESLWITLGISFALAIIFWILIRLLNNQFYLAFNRKRIKFNLPSHFKRQPMLFQYFQLCIDASILALGAPLRRFPRIQSERFLISGICLLSLNIVSVFQSQLATCFVHPMYYKNIATLHQFANTEMKIFIKYPAMMTDLFPANSSDLYKTLNSRMILIPNNDLITKDISEQHEMAGVTRRNTLKVSKEEDQVHLIPECPRSYNLAYVYNKHWVFADSLNQIILTVKQAGIINKWIDDINYDIKLESMKKQTFVHHRALTVDDLMLAFIILGLGTALSTTFLIIEFLCSRKFRR